jgi:hypothetical protein
MPTRFARRIAPGRLLQREQDGSQSSLLDHPHTSIPVFIHLEMEMPAVARSRSVQAGVTDTADQFSGRNQIARDAATVLKWQYR